MAVTRMVAFEDTTEQIVFAGACILKGVYVDNPARTATEGWIELYDASGVTPGTTEPDIILWCPWNVNNVSSLRFTFPRIRFATGMEAFYNDTTPIDASAWNGTAATGYAVHVYWERA